MKLFLSDLSTMPEAQRKQLLAQCVGRAFSMAREQVCTCYDETCLRMTMDEATWCFLGCPNHPCTPEHDGVGIADGYCPIITERN